MQVRRAITNGKLPNDPDGRLDADLLNMPWCRSRRASAKRALRLSEVSVRDGAAMSEVSDPPGAVMADVDALAERIVRSGPLLPLADAIQLKENSIARLRTIETDRAEGKLVLVADAVEHYGAECARIRFRLLAIPSSYAPQVARLKTPAEAQDFLATIITEALEDLSGVLPPEATPKEGCAWLKANRAVSILACAT